jgi:hypothetical protein
MELHCTGDLAMRLGAVLPRSSAEYRALRDAGNLLVRDPRSGWPLFWQWQLSGEETARSS